MDNKDTTFFLGYPSLPASQGPPLVFTDIAYASSVIPGDDDDETDPDMPELEPDSYEIDRNEEPENFFALCDVNLRLHREAIQESHETLKKNGVAEQYIFVVQANRDDPSKQGDIFAYTNQERLEETLHSVRNGAKVCCSPDVFIFGCFDVRDQATMARQIDAGYFKAKWFKEMVESHTDLKISGSTFF